MKITLKVAIPIIAVLFGFCAGAFFTFMIGQDEIGRHKQLIFTLEHVLKNNRIELTKAAVLGTINDMYPTNEVVVEENAIYIHRMEFYFKDGKYSHGDIGTLRK